MNVLGFCLVLREYPKGLGKALVKMYRELNIPEAPLACLRQKADIAYTSDLQLFNSLPMGDTWPDASLKDVYLYLWKFNKVKVPKEWASTLVQFTKELRAATWLLFLLGRWVMSSPSIGNATRPKVHDDDPFGLGLPNLELLD